MTDKTDKDVEALIQNIKSKSYQEKTLLIIVNIITLLSSILVAWLYLRHAISFQNKLAKEIEDRKEAEKVIRTAKEDAERASQEKTEFLAVMSHEIRTPMNSIMGFSKLLYEDEELTERGHKYAHTINAAASALLTILEDILVFSKLESNKVTLEDIPYDFGQTIEDVILLFQEKADDSNICVKSHISKEMPKYIMGDPSRLRQIIINLLSNAMKFTHEGGVTIDVSVKENAVFCRVIGTSIGISKDGQKKLFKKFEQEDSSTTRKYAGIGLGLSICKKLVELMNEHDRHRE